MRDAELKVSFEIEDPSGALFRNEFHMVFEGEHNLRIGSHFTVYADPADYSHFVLVPPKAR